MKMQRDNSLQNDITSPQRARLLRLFLSPLSLFVSFLLRLLLSFLSFRLFFFYEKKAYDI